jgi:hypothetical protein
MSAKYITPVEPMTTSARAAHYLVHCHKQRPGERISWREVARVIDNLQHMPTKANTKVVSLFRSSHHVGRVMREVHELDIETNGDGVRILDHVHDVVKSSVARAAKELDLKRKKLDDRLTLVNKKRGQFKDNEEGRALKRFVDRASAATKSVKSQLPSAVEIKGLLVSGDDD